MRENYEFHTIKKQTEAEQEEKKDKVKPITAKEHEKKLDEAPSGLKEHFFDFRRSIQEKIEPEKSSAEGEEKDDAERVKLLRELISPELISKYNEIVKTFNEKIKI